MQAFLMKDGDLVLGSNNHLVRATEVETIAQTAAHWIDTNLGEDYIDPHVGIRYLGLGGAIGKPINQVTIEQEILTALLNTEGVRRAEIKETEFDEARRIYKPGYILYLEDNTVLERG
ncbi:hypothetical protein PM10SUCC1_32280 [Propionigenium maris DSM 9537]|uniref:Uncharacterized protein n=1 Tax=Propionigenium maris DSM 9537 TaxID=1123000 RepID=A0A9W6GMB3_9FUSO|nr:hypothetical protein [Propionigenium maris]GLI57714.1 hypothetical protein PM10SUCC1_32280 [Propionigenium maris DSM 9537]